MTYSDVSVVITNYNYGKYILRSIRSCFSQKIVKPEVILVDDCSTDNSEERIQPFLDDLVYIKNEENMGVAFSSNRGIEKARGQYLMRLDADDYINEYTLFLLRTYLIGNPDAFCVSCDYILVDEYGSKIERKYAQKDPVSCGILYRRDLLWELGGYNSEMRHKEEEELRNRLGIKYNIHHLQLPLYRYRMHDSNKTKQPDYKTWKID